MFGTNELWDYFTKIEKVRCKFCKKEINYNPNVETDLRGHLRRNHETAYNSLWPPTETRSSPQCYQSDHSIPSTSTPTTSTPNTSTTFQNRGPNSCARSNNRQISTARKISNEQGKNVSLSSVRRSTDDHGIPSTSTPTTSTPNTSTTFQNRGPNSCARSNNRQISTARKISNVQGKNVSLFSVGRSTDDHGIRTTNIKNRKPNARAVVDEGPRSNKRQKSMDLNSDRNIPTEQGKNINLFSTRRPTEDHSIASTSTTIQNRRPYACAFDDKVIGCDDPDEAENSKEVTIENLPSNYEITDVEKPLLKVKIVRLHENHSTDDIVKYLKCQNKIFSEESHLKVLKISPVFREPGQFEALIELDADTYVLLMNLGKVLVKFDVCPAYDASGIRFCHRCSGFYHRQYNCPNKAICSKCAGNHTSNYCSSSVYKCINCTNANLTDNSHAAYDVVKCPIFKNYFVTQ